MRLSFVLLSMCACQGGTIGAGVDGAAAGGADARPRADAFIPPDAAAPDPLSYTLYGGYGGIRELSFEGTNLFEGVGGYYIIGSCTGADDNDNVHSQDTDGTTLASPGSCPGAPFSMTFSGLHPIRVAITIGPLPVDYRTLSVPLDPRKDFFTRFAFDGDGYEVGCALSWSPRPGSGGAFADIPTPCLIPDVGGVGVARVQPLPAWGRIEGPIATIERRVISSDGAELDFYNHPGTNNIEIGWNGDFAEVLPAGTVVHLEEEISVSGE